MTAMILLSICYLTIGIPCGVIPYVVFGDLGVCTVLALYLVVKQKVLER